MFWLLATVLTLIVLIAISWPFWHAAQSQAEPAAAYDLRVYRDQLAEVDRDVSRGIIDAADAERLRNEIGRKVLDADRALRRDRGPGQAGGRYGVAAGVVLLVLLLAGTALYLRMGTPGQPDMALQSRIASAEVRYDSRPSQAEAEQRAGEGPRRDMPTPSAQYTELIEQLREAVAERPEDIEGLTLLARNEARLGNAIAAKDAQQRLIAVKGEAATSADHAFLAGVMTEAAGGLITPEAEAEMKIALRKDPGNAQARYMAGLLEAQNGRPDRAFPIWAQLLEDSPPDSPWSFAIREVIGDIAWLAGQPDYVPPDPAQGARGPDADQMAAAAEMTPEERRDFIRSMVDQLEGRLAAEGGTPDEWARLISSLVIIGDREHAAEILAEARTRYANDPNALSAVNAAAAGSGLE
ncbi:c-type cytochrome biogenesis protein CcmI [Paracoccus aerodenitrificans]|uniref:c-type cytochrome biogenesis protein CcmI n=1 Tax=Paracoccus aerodenitrificans TaxID=3017781 RepID=UPI0022F1352A|nr:c-type cytochrome biogenesis protein CcmI [Paracoccus aerodenitrificans]WBU63334.1 c-type cytochrome biogenesis protein CcmI [Paracoccus aerodenitrificans]